MRNREAREAFADAILSLMGIVVLWPLLELLDRIDF